MTGFELLPAWLAPESAVSLGAGVAALAAVFALWQGMVARHPMERASEPCAAIAASWAVSSRASTSSAAARRGA